MPAGAAASIVTYEPAGDQIKVTVDDTDTDGHSTHLEWIGKVDGKDYPVASDLTASTWSFKKINDRALIFTTKKAGKVQAIRRMTVSADGKTRISTGTRIDANGKKATVTTVYEKD